MKLNEIREVYGIFPHHICVSCKHKYQADEEEPCKSCELTNFEYDKKGE